MKQQDIATARTRLSAAGLDPADVRWLDSLGFNDAAIPPVESEAQAADYERRASRLSALAAGLSLWERETALESKLAAAIGARIADWKDRLSGDDED